MLVRKMARNGWNILPLSEGGGGGVLHEKVGDSRWKSRILDLYP